jgi:hypothetical protein
MITDHRQRRAARARRRRHAGRRWWPRWASRRRRWPPPSTATSCRATRARAACPCATATPSSPSSPSPEADPMAFSIGGVTLESRFFLGTAGYPSPQVLQDAIAPPARRWSPSASSASSPAGGGAGDFYRIIARERRAPAAQHRRLPHRARGRDAGPHGARAVRHPLDQAGGGGRRVHAAARPLRAGGRGARRWRKDGFEVFPYCTDDLVTCQRLLDAGCRILMPWGAPIGSGQGLLNPTRCARCARACPTCRWWSTPASARRATRCRRWSWATTPCW